MSFAVSTGRSLTLTARCSDLEYQIMLITNRQQQLAVRTQAIAEKYSNQLSSTSSTATTAGTTTEDNTTIDDSSFTAAYEAQMYALNAQDKQMDLERTNLETQYKAVTTEMESVDKVIDKDVKRSFGTFGS